MYNRKYYWHLKKIHTDSAGNDILIAYKKTRTVFYLDLKKGKYLRNIWYVSKKDWIFYTKRDDITHIYIKTKAFWFNRNLLDYLVELWVESVCVDTGRALKYYTYIKDILVKWAEHKNYKDSWYELQVFAPITVFTLDL